MIVFDGSCWVVKGRVKEFMGSTQLGFEKDEELDHQEEYIIPVLEMLISKLPEVKKVKNAVFFVEFEDGKWLDTSKSFKQAPKFVKVCRKNYSPANWKKFNRMAESFDKKDNVGEAVVLRHLALIGL